MSLPGSDVFIRSGAWHVRAYLRQFFDSEVPRLFWQRHGEWHLRRTGRTRDAKFRQLMNEEYLRAVKSGPPSRRYEASDVWFNRPYHGLRKEAAFFANEAGCTCGRSEF